MSQPIPSSPERRFEIIIGAAMLASIIMYYVKMRRNTPASPVNPTSSCWLRKLTSQVRMAVVWGACPLFMGRQKRRAAFCGSALLIFEDSSPAPMGQ